MLSDLYMTRMFKSDTIRSRAATVLTLIAVVAVAVAAGSAASRADAQDSGGGGTPAPNFSEPCPAVYPGDAAARERLARWMARGAADRGMPHELPVMAAIAESGIRNLSGPSYAGFFGMHESLNSGDYRGFRRNPTLQLRWFLDTAALVRQRRVAVGRTDPAADPLSFGSWIADVERPAPQNRAGYQPHLGEARELIANKCAPPARDDTAPPRLQARIPRPQHPLATGGIVAGVRSPDNDCLAGVTVRIGTRTTRSAPSEPGTQSFTTLTAPVPRKTRRALRAGRTIRARITVIAADNAANTTSRTRLVTLEG
jgi:hypothetical protein